jgi:hypothetical protein
MFYVHVPHATGNQFESWLPHNILDVGKSLFTFILELWTGIKYLLCP